MAATGRAKTAFDIAEIELTLLSNAALRIRGLPDHVTMTRAGLKAFLDIFGTLPEEGGTLGLVDERPGEEDDGRGPTVIVRYADVKTTTTAKACLDQVHMPNSKLGLDCGWLLDTEADRLLERQPTGWFARVKNNDTERQLKILRAEEAANRQRDAELAAIRKRAQGDVRAVVQGEDEASLFTCCLLRGLFSRAEEEQESGPEWAAMLRDDVHGEIADLEPKSIAIDDWTDNGRVIIRFGDERVAAACAQRLNGRAFGPRTVEGHVVSLEQAERVLEGRPSVAAPAAPEA